MIKLEYFRAPAMTMLALMLLFPGCKKKQPKIAEPPPQATAPAIEAEPEPQPVEPAMPEPAARGDAPPPEATAAPPKPKPRRRKPSAQIAKATPPAQPATEPAATAPAAQPAPAQPAAAPPLSATITTEGSQRQQNEAEEMLAKTDANVRSVTRELSEEEKAMLRQIESFVQQARDALKVGDTVRAHNLAQKAHLLSTELAKR